MKRLTSNNTFEMNMTELALNQVSVENGWAWYLKAPEDECSVCDLIRSAATKGLKLEEIELDPNLTDEELGDVMLEWLQFGETEPEGILAILYRALWAMGEVRERLKLYEDICFDADGAELLTSGILKGVRHALSNEPLTIKQLREMDGEPVWVVSTDGSFEPCWGLINCLDKNVYDSENEFCPFRQYGKTWLAYRRKPEVLENAE